MAALLLALGLGLLGTAAVAQGTDPYQHPHPQPPLSAAPPPTCNGGVLAITTGTSPFPQSYPFIDPPGTNFLPTVYTDLYDAAGRQIPNTLPSTPTIPYNLLDGEPVVTTINPVSPADDLGAVFDAMLRAPSYSEPADQEAVVRKIQMGIDVLEGNPVPHRAYSGLPVLHYDGPAKVKQVVPVTDARGTVIGGNVDVHQVWYGGRIESDTAMIDLTPLTGLPNAADLTWTITYHVDVLSRGEDDFSPFVMYLDTSSGMGKPWIAMDQAFFPMQDGTRTVFKVKMAPSPNYSLVYTWGWRMHPPRAQVMENAHKQVTAFTNPCDSSTGTTQTTQQWEISVFGPDPRGSEANKLAAIAKIGDLAPEKKMWTALRAARSAAAQRKWLEVRRQGTLGKEAWFDFLDRTKLPGDLKPDPKSDLTLLYVNNTIYGEFTEGTLTRLPDYQTRGFTARITLLNGDNFPHGYQNVDFGGGRGWENQFKSSVKVGGSGCWFTFGRVYFSMLVPNVPLIPPAQGTKPSKQQVAMTFNFDPSRRLRFYQFDPLHHDTAIFSVH
ncbi:MAG TPA: hypothetical protein DD490_14360 [Acidobacteria bacterium]|nr:hypothetical protein [Acidobacteriota bacterium]